MNSSINVNELMCLYLDTLEKCSRKLLKESDSIIEYYIFEELDIGITSFLHIENLNKLKHAKYIDQAIVDKSIKLRSMFISLQNTEFWNKESVKTYPIWKIIFSLSDEIKEDINNLKK